METLKVARNYQALVKVLKAYCAAPGTYALNLGQPALLFQEFELVIAWAQGKVSDSLASQSDELQRAAIFFVQRACFRHENSHYDVLGIGRKFNLDELRLRYRALISLTHPDKGIHGLPSNAAVRINLAYETLRDAGARADYDITLMQEPAIPLRPSSAAPASYDLEMPTWNERLQGYLPSGKKLVFFATFVLVVVFVVAMVVESQNPTDLQLVEKSAVKVTNSGNSAISWTDLPQSATSLYNDLSESGRQWLSTNTITVPIATQRLTYSNAAGNNKPSANLAVNNDLQQIEVSQKQPHKSALDSEQVDIATDVASISNGAHVSNVHTSASPIKVSEIEVAKPAINPVQVANSMVLKASATIQNVSEPKRSNLQLNEARLSVTQSISALERLKDAEFLQSKMSRQGVSGNLFGLVLPHIRQAAVIRVDQLLLKEKLENNRMTLNGSVVLWLGATASQLLPYKYMVNVEFSDAETSPVMSSFDVR